MALPIIQFNQLKAEKSLSVTLLSYISLYEYVWKNHLMRSSKNFIAVFRSCAILGVKKTQLVIHEATIWNAKCFALACTKKKNSIGLCVGYPTTRWEKPLLLLIASLQIQQRVKAKRRDETTWNLHNKHRLPCSCTAAGAGFYSGGTTHWSKLSSWSTLSSGSCCSGSSPRCRAARRGYRLPVWTTLGHWWAPHPATSLGQRRWPPWSSKRVKSHAASVMSRAVMCRSRSERLPGCDGQPPWRLCFLITHAEGVESH